jgi:C4-type Zn-finger protein
MLMARRRSDDDDDDDRPRPNTKVPCPKCGGRSVRLGPWPWYLGTIGAIMCKAVICNECGHEYDEKKPDANLATRKRNLAIGINVVGLLGIIGVFGGLALWLSIVMK